MRAWPEAPKGNLILRSALLRASRRMGHVHLRILATWICPRLTISFAPLRKRAHATLKRGRGEDRVRAAPAVSCAFDALENAHTSIQVQRKHSGLPCAMALRLIRALVSAKFGRMCERAVLAKPPVAGSEPDRARRP